MTNFEWPWTVAVRPVLQSEAAECGLAALTMVARHHGHRVDLIGMRQRYPTSIKGMTLKDLMAVASDLDLAPRALRLEVEELDKLQLPAILHWDLNHFVVVERVARDWITILDPARGRIRIAPNKLGRHFTGVALELTPTADFKPINVQVKTRLSDLWSRITNFRQPLIQILLLSGLVQLTALVVPLFVQLVVDEGISQSDSGLLLMLLLGFGFIYALQSVTRMLRNWVILCLGESLTFQLAGNIVRHMLRLPMAYFERRHIGDLLSRMGSIQPIQSLLTTGIVGAVIDSLLTVTTLAIMLAISVPLTAIVVVCTIAYLVVTHAAYPAQRARAEEEIVARANADSFQMESLRSMRAIKLHGFETMRENGWRNRYAEVISAAYKSRMTGIRLGFAEDAIFDISFLLTVYFAAVAVLNHNLTVGMMFAFLSYRSSFAASASSLIQQWQNWRLLGLHLERLSDIVTEKKEVLAAAQPRTPAIVPPAIRARGLTFSYDPTERPILDNVDFDIPAGALVAITGPSGAGKSTLMRILLGLLTPQGGKLDIDGHPLGPMTMASWRERIGAVMQDDYLLSGTLGDNISFFDPQPNQELVEGAAKFARIHDDIAKMPMAYHSLISDMGAALSAGQRQRVLLARALYREPDILMLDEGTANLDVETEDRIARSIAAMPITRVVIAHRPALVELAEIVLNVDGGKVVRVRDADRRTASVASEWRQAG